MGFLTAVIMIVLSAASAGVLVTLPSAYQTPILYIVPVVLFIFFLISLK